MGNCNISEIVCVSMLVLMKTWTISSRGQLLALRWYLGNPYVDAWLTFADGFAPSTCHVLLLWRKCIEAKFPILRSFLWQKFVRRVFLRQKCLRRIFLRQKCLWRIFLRQKCLRRIFLRQKCLRRIFQP